MATHRGLATSQSPLMVTDDPLKFHQCSICRFCGDHQWTILIPPVILWLNYRCPILIRLRRKCGTSVLITDKLATELEHPGTKIAGKNLNPVYYVTKSN